jgi:stage II sporulation protein M
MKYYLINYVQDNKRWLAFALKLFFIAMVAGALGYFFKPDFIKQIAKVFTEKFGANPVPNFHLVKEIFLQNAIVSAIVLIGGMVFGITSFFIIFVNGFILGFIFLSVFFGSGNLIGNFLYLILGLLPHGIFEIPAFLVASSSGLRLGTEWMQKSSSGKRFYVWKKDLGRAFRVFPLILLALIIASFVEVFVTGRIISYF